MQHLFPASLLFCSFSAVLVFIQWFFQLLKLDHLLLLLNDTYWYSQIFNSFSFSFIFFFKVHFAKTIFYFNFYFNLNKQQFFTWRMPIPLIIGLPVTRVFVCLVCFRSVGGLHKASRAKSCSVMWHCAENLLPDLPCCATHAQTKTSSNPQRPQGWPVTDGWKSEWFIWIL